jgi:uncharacterized membrane protein YqhA
MFKKLLAIRYVFIVAVLFTLINSIFFIVGGVLESIKGITILIKHGLEGEERPGLYLLKSLDLFLVSMVFMIVGLGIVRLFGIAKTDTTNLPKWLDIESFKELKILIWETVIVTMVVFTLTSFVSSGMNLHWEQLVLPGLVLILSVGLYFMKKV